MKEGEAGKTFLYSNSQVKIMASKHIIIGLIIGILVGGFAGFLVAPSPDVSGLESQVEQLQQQVSALQDDVSSKNTEISKLQAELSVLQIEKNTLESSLEMKNSAISHLEDQVTQLDDRVDFLENEVIRLENQVDFTFVDASFSRIEDTYSILEYWIGRANETIQVMVMLITHDELADALISAHNRGVEIKIIIDDDWLYSSGSDYQKILDAGMDIRGDERGGLMHHKVMIIDGYVIVVGSYNWSASAEGSNDENVLIIESLVVADEYLEEFNRIWGQTAPSEPPSEPPSPPPTAQYELTISISGSGSTEPSQGTHSYDEGSTIQVTAYPASGWDFDNWLLDEDNVGSQNPYSITINKDYELIAIFEEEPSPPPTEGVVVINEVEANPPGNDNYGSVYEWVELYNPSSVSVDIGGWKVSTTHGTTVTITIPQGTTLKPGKYFVVERGQQWIDNEDEKIVLKDADGNVKDRSKTIIDDYNDDRSWQRVPDGGSSWSFKSSTKNAPN